MAKKSKGKRQPIGLVRWIIIIICAMVFCGSAAHLLLYATDKMAAEKDFKELRESVRDLSTVYAQNSDLVGWINVPGTKIDYPVMQTKDDPEFYLHRDFKKESSASGTPFLDAGSTVLPRSEDEEVTWNWLIYGHHMKFGTMFHDLMEFEDKKFWEGHKTFTFAVYDPATGKTDNGEYEVFAVSRSKIRAEDSDAFKYYQYAGLTSEEKFNEYVAGVEAESSYDTGITPEFGDQLVTLSTCAYHTKEGRFYVVGRRIQ
ncbi:MAG: class B sortase [Clostridia bacterium]|nr:class B sortase [Clostridia bacterium]